MELGKQLLCSIAMGECTPHGLLVLIHLDFDLKPNGGTRETQLLEKMTTEDAEIAFAEAAAANQRELERFENGVTNLRTMAARIEAASYGMPKQAQKQHEVATTLLAEANKLNEDVCRLKIMGDAYKSMTAESWRAYEIRRAGEWQSVLDACCP